MSYLHDLLNSGVFGEGEGGGGDVTIEPLSVNKNGIYTAPSGKAYSPVTVDVFKMQTFATKLDSAFSSGSYVDPIPTDIPKNIVIDAPNCFSIYNMFSQSSIYSNASLGIESVTLILHRPVAARGTFSRNYSIKTVSFPNGITIKGEVASFIQQSHVEEITGIIDLSPGMTVIIGAFASNYLKKITFAKNCIDFSTAFTSDVLTDASLVSIANALSDEVSGKTLTHTATAKTRCGQIVGTVSDGLFTQDDSGSLTLTEFITNEKGWTLA